MSALQMEVFKFIVVKGHQVASGKAEEPRFPIGIINVQATKFKVLALNIDGFHLWKAYYFKLP